jgi:hypothetical protein
VGLTALVLVSISTDARATETKKLASGVKEAARNLSNSSGMAEQAYRDANEGTVQFFEGITAISTVSGIRALARIPKGQTIKMPTFKYKSMRFELNLLGGYMINDRRGNRALLIDPKAPFDPRVPKGMHLLDVSTPAGMERAMKHFPPMRVAKNRRRILKTTREFMERADALVNPHSRTAEGRL